MRKSVSKKKRVLVITNSTPNNLSSNLSSSLKTINMSAANTQTYFFNLSKPEEIRQRKINRIHRKLSFVEKVSQDTQTVFTNTDYEPIKVETITNKSVLQSLSNLNLNYPKTTDKTEKNESSSSLLLKTMSKLRFSTPQHFKTQIKMPEQTKKRIVERRPSRSIKVLSGSSTSLILDKNRKEFPNLSKTPKRSHNTPKADFKEFWSYYSLKGPYVKRLLTKNFPYRKEDN